MQKRKVSVLIKAKVKADIDPERKMQKFSL